jgi:methyl-accepting chemotaxis protein
MAYKRSILLINRPFQIKFSFYVCSWILALSLIYPWIIYNQLEQFLRYVALDPLGPELSKLHSIRNEMLGLIVALQVVFMLTISVVSVILSHRIAGPIYKMTQFFSKVVQGSIAERISFRKADHFQELAGSYNEMMDALEDRVSQACTAIESGKSDEALKILKRLRGHRVE